MYSGRLNNDGSIAVWNNTYFNNPPRRYLAAVVATNGSAGCGDQWDRLYILGGESDGWENTTIVEYAKVDANGIYGSWTQSSYHLLEGRSRFAAAAYGSYIYSIGGYNWGAKDTVEGLGLDGNCEPAGAAYVTSLPSRRMNHSGVAANGYVWVFGGYDNSGNLLNDVWAAKVNSIGTLGNWQRVNRFEKAVANAPTTVWNGYIVMTGGHATSGEIKNVQVLPANILPTVEGWVQTTSMPLARNWHGTVTNNGYIYLVGGWSSPNAYINDVRSAAIDPDGSVGEWNQTSSLSIGRYGHATFVHGRHVYALAGRPQSGAAPSEFAVMNADGSLGQWTPTTIVPGNVQYVSAAVYAPGGGTSDAVYVVGGYTPGPPGAPTSAVWKNTFDTDGHLRDWTQMVSLPIALYGTATVITGNTIVVTGGAPFNAGRGAEVYSSAINPSTGDLVGWQTETSMPEPRAFHTATYFNGNIFVAGGDGGSAFYDDVMAAPYDAFGNVGTWRFVRRLPQTLLGHGAVENNGNLYVTGGTNDYFNSKDTVYFSPLEAP